MDLTPANDLVELAVAKLGAAGRELAPRQKQDARRRVAEALGYSGDRQQRIYRWRATGPKYRDTIMLLDLCGFLTPQGRDFLGLVDRPESDEGLADRDRIDRTAEDAADLSKRPPHRQRRARDEPRSETS